MKLYIGFIVVFAAVVAFSLFVVILTSCNSDYKIESIRFGIIESMPLRSGSTELFLIKDQRTKKQYLLCANCTLTEYKEKK